MRLYTQEPLEEFDYYFCGSTLPPPIASEGPTLLLVFSSGSSQGQGFKGKYHFETDFKVPGTISTPGECHFTYQSASAKTGDINSPRFPSNYPSSIYCVYEFYGEKDEQVKVVFNSFKIKPELVVSGYNEVCQEDWLELYEIHPDGKEVKFGRYCSKSAPGPIITEVGINRMKIILNTDDAGVASGFSATYNFIKAIRKIGGNKAFYLQLFVFN